MAGTNNKILLARLGFSRQELNREAGSSQGHGFKMLEARGWPRFLILIKGKERVIHAKFFSVLNIMEQTSHLSEKLSESRMHRICEHNKMRIVLTTTKLVAWFEGQGCSSVKPTMQLIASDGNDLSVYLCPANTN